MRIESNNKPHLLALVIILALLIGGKVSAQFLLDVKQGPHSSIYGYTYVYSSVSCLGEDCLTSYVLLNSITPTIIFERSTDGGNTWSQQSTFFANTMNGGKDEVRSITQIDSLIAVGSNSNGRIFRTSDGGVTWNIQLKEDTCSYGVITFYGPKEGMALGADSDISPIIITTSDSGKHWQRAPFAASRQVSGKAYGNGKYRIFQALFGKIFTTTDNWKTVDSTESILDSQNRGSDYNAQFGSGDTIIAFGQIWNASYTVQSGAITRSTDAGKHWEKPTVFADPYFPYITCISDINRDTIIAGSGVYGECFYLLMSTDRGATWRRDTLRFDRPLPYYQSLRDISITGRGNIVAVFESEQNGMGGFIAVGRPPKAGVKNMITLSAPLLYPNPATTSVAISLPEAGTLRLLDILGREVLHEATSGGDVRLDVSKIPRGIYSVLIESAKGTLRVGKVAVVER